MEKQQRGKKMFKKLISLFLSLNLILVQSGFAQGVAELNLGQYLGQMSNNLAVDKFWPLHLRYFSYDPATDNFQLLLDKGDNPDIKDKELEDKTKVLMEYFQIGLALPNDKFWVNLRPDAQDQIIDPELEKTDLGKIMLEADLQLKKDTAQWTSPQTPEGKQYWDKLYQKARELFGSEPANIPTITRPWIVPGEIIVREGETSAYIFKANLKVMLEEDYLSSQPSAISSQQYNFKDPRMKELNTYSTQLIRELIIPQLTKEVNTSKRYAALRQVFFSLIMARWFKERYRGVTRNQSTETRENSYIKLIDSGNLNNLTSKEPWSKTTYFNEYKKSFENGEYNLKENLNTPSGQVIRSYVSGGIFPMPKKEQAIGYLNKKDGSAHIWVLGGIFSAILLSTYLVAVPGMEKGWKGLYYDLSEGRGEISKESTGHKEIYDKIKTILDKYGPHYEITYAIGGKSNTYQINISNRSSMKIAPIQKDGRPAYAVKASFPFKERRYSYSIFSVNFYVDENGRMVVNYPPYLSEQKAIESVDEVVNKLDEISRSAGSSLLAPYQDREELKDRLGTLKEYLPNKEPIIYQFAEFLSGRLFLEKFFPDQFILAIDLAIDDLRTGIDRFTGKSITGPLVDHFSQTKTGTPPHEIIPLFDIVGAVAPKEFVEEVKNIYNKFLFDSLPLTDKEQMAHQVDNIVEDYRKTIESIAKQYSSGKTLSREISEFVNTILNYGWVTMRGDLSSQKPETAIMKVKNFIQKINNGMENFAKEGALFETPYISIETRMYHDNGRGGLTYNEELRDKVSKKTVDRRFFITSRDEESAKKAYNAAMQELDKLLVKIKSSSLLGENGIVSSPFEKQVGGIDFRIMQMLIQPMGSFRSLNLSLPTLSSSALQRIDLDQELAALRNMVKAGLVPSGARVKEYLAAVFQKGRMAEKQDDLLVCLAEIYRLQEEEVLETSPELMESLVIVDTGRFVLLPNSQRAGLN